MTLALLAPRVPGALPLLFLGYLLVLLPWAGVRGARRLAALRADPEGALAFPSRRAIWLRTIVVQLVLLFIAWRTGQTFDYEPFAVPALGVADVAAALVALLLCHVLAWVARVWRPEGERRGMFVYAVAPRSPLEWILWGSTVLVAAVAEEVAYRGVGTSILWWSLGDPWSASVVCALAFAAAHWAQGAKSVVVIFVIALVLQALVVLTGTLVLAMAVHGAHNAIAGLRIQRQARAYDAEAATP